MLLGVEGVICIKDLVLYGQHFFKFRSTILIQLSSLRERNPYDYLCRYQHEAYSESLSRMPPPHSLSLLYRPVRTKCVGSSANITSFLEQNQKLCHCFKATHYILSWGFINMWMIVLPFSPVDSEDLDVLNQCLKSIMSWMRVNKLKCMASTCNNESSQYNNTGRNESMTKFQG